MNNLFFLSSCRFHFSGLLILMLMLLPTKKTVLPLFISVDVVNGAIFDHISHLDQKDSGTILFYVSTQSTSYDFLALFLIFLTNAMIDTDDNSPHLSPPPKDPSKGISIFDWLTHSFNTTSHHYQYLCISVLVFAGSLLKQIQYKSILSHVYINTTYLGWNVRTSSNKPSR